MNQFKSIRQELILATTVAILLCAVFNLCLALHRAWANERELNRQINELRMKK